MTYRKSLGHSIWENNKRRRFVWVISAIYFVLSYPVGLLLDISSVKTNYGLMQMDAGALSLMLERTARDWMGYSDHRVIFTSMLAILCAIQSYSYLFDRSKTDFYESKPVPKFRRFAVNYINGAAIYVIPKLIAILLALPICLWNGLLSGKVMKITLLAFVSGLLLYLAVYSLAALAALLTGSVLAACFGTAVLLSYEALLQSIIIWWKGHYFLTYSGWNYTSVYLSPYPRYMQSAEYAFNIVEGNGGVAAFLACCLYLALLAVLVAAAAWLCFRFRPGEAPGRTMAYPKSRGAVRFLISVPLGLTCGILVDEFAYGGSYYKDSNQLTIVIAVVLGTFFISCLIQIFFESDIRAAFHKKYHLLAGMAAVLVFYGIFRLDVFGYDRFLPDPDKVDSAVLSFGNMEDYSVTWFDAETPGRTYSPRNYLISHMKLSDTQTICELAEKGLQRVYGIRNGEEDTVDDMGTVAYRMKNGRVKYRRIPIDYVQDEAMLNKLLGSEEFKEGYLPYYREDFLETYLASGQGKSVRVAYNNGIEIINIPSEAAQRILAAYREDLSNWNFTVARDEFVRGSVQLMFMDSHNSADYAAGEQLLDIYSSFDRTIACLKEYGIEAPADLPEEEIVSICVQEVSEQDDIWVRGSYAGISAGNERDEESGFHVYNEPEEIRQIVPLLYNRYLNDKFKPDSAYDDRYYITIQFRNGNTEQGGSYCFLEGQYPELIVK